MLPEYEIAIARGYDIEQTRKHLTEQARNDYQDQCQIIEHDAKIAELIMYVLRHEPTWSPGYGVARGLQRRFIREHPEDNKLVREIRKAVWMDGNEPSDKEKRREDDDHESNEGTAEVTQHTGRNERSGETSPTAVHEAIPEGS